MRGKGRIYGKNAFFPARDKKQQRINGSVATGGIKMKEQRLLGRWRETLKNGGADVIWYAVCFMLLGLIDQRRGSAEGSVQMAFANLTGVAAAMLLLPSVKREFWRTKHAKIWSILCVPLLACGFFLGRKVWMYPGQWNTAVLNAALMGYAVLYVVWDREALKKKSGLQKVFFWSVMGMLLLMLLSPHGALWPLLFLCMFGSFYLIGIPKEKEETLLLGMLLGVIAWFFIQQTIAFGFRPYDYDRYRGLYSGETQSGLFYMIVFCAFTGMWLLLKKRKAKPFWRILCFLLSAGSVSFQMLTGGRSSFLGIFAGAVVAYMAYDMIVCNSFKHWIIQGMMLGICALVLFPAVYGCVRYLPTILHHPIWFQGEYREWGSVRSYDPRDSERYISFESALNVGIGRIFDLFGITLQLKDGKLIFTLPGDLTAHAAELGEPGEPGSSPENPYYWENSNWSDSINVRLTIYFYYAAHLNLWGHRESGDFYISEYTVITHAHNMFLQVAYDYGVIAGVIFLVLNLWCFLRLLGRKDMAGIIGAAFLAAILVYGFAETAVTTGQITWNLLFILYYFGMQKREKSIVA